jgi:predicted nucleic-acid-binding protein
MDDPGQSALAAQTLREADIVAVPLPALCEYAWVLRTAYKRTRTEVAASIEALLDTPGVHTDESATRKGLEALRRGGDLADAVIAYEGLWLGGEEFVTFDRKAAELLPEIGIPARRLAS